jgi:exopolysaccharide biosynthesis WecB/TagA/CpsF family protein
MTAIFLTIVAWMICLPLLVVTGVFCVQCITALLPKIWANKNIDTFEQPRPRVAVLIPAHNEELSIAGTLQTILPQMREGDRVMIVADNCTDRTAEVARRYAVEVVERTDANRRGKGYALDFGIRLLENDPPKILIIVDADCVAQEGMVQHLARQVAVTGLPAQSIYLMEPPQYASARDHVSFLAVLVKNWVRPAGMARLGMPCMMSGAGMAFPWNVIRKAPLASGNIVEDMQLGLDLAIAGSAPMFCAEARVSARLPERRADVNVQRTRWEHGHLRTALKNCPRLMVAALQHRDLGVAAMALDLAVPPLSLLLIGVTAIDLMLWMLTLILKISILPAASLSLAVALVGFVVLATWFKFARSYIPIGSLIAAPFYAIAKLPLYAAFLVRPQQEWIRTARTKRKVIRRRRRSSRRMPNKLPTTSLFGVRVHVVSETQCIDRVISELHVGRGGVVVTPNLDHLVRSRRDRNFAAILRDADLAVADGMPLVWASKLSGAPLPERVAGSNLILSISDAAEKHSRSVFLLGGDPGTAVKAAEIMAARYPKLKCVGTYCPPFGFEQIDEEMEQIRTLLIDAAPDIVFVALGSPKQERLIAELRDILPRSWWLGVGISFSFVAGDVNRAPRWLQKIGLEWLHRLVQEPRRLARRYLVNNLPYAVLLLSSSAIKGLFYRSYRLMRSPARNGNVATSATSERMPLPAYADVPISPIPEIKAQEPALKQLSLPKNKFQRSKPLEKLQGIVLLGGVTRPTPLAVATGRSVLDMPLDDGRSLLMRWCTHADELRKLLELSKISCRLLVDRRSSLPSLLPGVENVELTAERDSGDYRGSGGALRDAAHCHDDDAYLLVANAAQVLLPSLATIASDLAATNADISFVSHDDGTPGGVFLVRCAALRGISPVGYVDLKEQAVPQIARRFSMRHVRYPHATGLAVRTLTDYVRALQVLQQLKDAEAIANETMPQRTARRPFTIIEHGAYVHPSAHIYDSVIMRDARIEAGAIVVRSVACSGSTLKRLQMSVDSILLPSSRLAS